MAVAQQTSDAFSTELLEFYSVCERLKRELRHSWLSNGRQESVGEHVWMAALLAMCLAPKMPPGVDPMRVLQLLIVHDISETLAGDVASFDIPEGNTQRHANEVAAIQTLSRRFPLVFTAQLQALWHEFEEGQTADALYARSIDCLEVQMQHNLADISTWIEKEYRLMDTKLIPRCQQDAFLAAFAERVAAEGRRKLTELNPL